MADFHVRSTAPIKTYGHQDRITAILFLLSILFNSALAVVNGHLKVLTPATVIASEIVIVTSIHLVALRRWRPEMAQWYLLASAISLFAVARSLLLGYVELKDARDALLIPTFVVLGMTYQRDKLPSLILILHGIVVGALILEAVDTNLYSEIFRVKDYFINTRGYDPDSFWNEGSELFVSATRPESRFFAFVELHRLSSIFLEPVSLGNYCVVLVCYLCAFWRSNSLAGRASLVLGTVLALVGCDGRLAAISAVIIIATTLCLPFLPKSSAILCLPVVTALTFAVVYLFGFKPGTDDFPGRLAHTVHLLLSYELPDFLGLATNQLAQAVDSGLAYVIGTQSLVGLAAIWLVIANPSDNASLEERTFIVAACAYIALTMMVSYSFLSIKTASIVWFIYGASKARADLASTFESERDLALERGEAQSRF